jgi:hypothetical protein
MDHDDFIWVTGLLEGEGSFHWHKKSKGPSISTRMKDRDVVERVSKILEAKMYGPYTTASKPQYSAVYAVTLYGVRAVEWMEKLKPFMGERRKGQIEFCLSQWIAREVMTPDQRMEKAREFRFATQQQRDAQRDQALKIGLGTHVRPN